MTTMTFGGLRPTMTTGTAKSGARATGPLARIASAWALWQAERALGALGDEALHDIGLDRASISHAVRTGERN